MSVTRLKQIRVIAQGIRYFLQRWNITSGKFKTYTAGNFSCWRPNAWACPSLSNAPPAACGWQKGTDRNIADFLLDIRRQDQNAFDGIVETMAYVLPYAAICNPR